MSDNDIIVVVLGVVFGTIYLLDSVSRGSKGPTLFLIRVLMLGIVVFAAITVLGHNMPILQAISGG